MREIEDLVALVAEIGPAADYLLAAQGALPSDHPWRRQAEDVRGKLLGEIAIREQRSAPGFQAKAAQALRELKDAYQTTYLELHRTAHLGAREEVRRTRLQKDPRLKQLAALDAVEIMPHQQLLAFDAAMRGLKASPVLSRSDLDANPICPHTHYRPVENPTPTASASQVLASLEDRLDHLLDDWTETLLANLADPAIRDNIALISDQDGKAAIEAFLATRELPDPVTRGLVQALREALTGLEKVEIRATDLRDALAHGGLPCTVQELRRRFERHVAGLTTGKAEDRIRVVIE